VTVEGVARTVEGELVVSYRSSSYLIASVVPIEIRNARCELVMELTGPTAETKLVPGLYSVTAILDNGCRETQSVQITPGGRSPVEFDTTPKDRHLEIARGLGDTRPVEPMNVVTPEALIYQGDQLPHLPGATNWVAPDTCLFAVSHGLRFAIRGSNGVAVFLDRPATAPAWVAFANGPDIRWVALPLDGLSQEGSECVIRVGPLAPRIELPETRSVTNLLRTMMTTGKTGRAFDFAERATDLLASKYKDPIGAVYGGLVLHQFGALESRASWIENLAHDFAWLVDARVLLAAVLARRDSEADRDRGFDALLDATRTPWMVFGEAFSLALSLLRRWPQPAKHERCRDRLADLGSIVKRFEFDATFSSMRWTVKR
jgi:hypothetical protein